MQPFTKPFLAEKHGLMLGFTADRLEFRGPDESLQLLLQLRLYARRANSTTSTSQATMMAGHTFSGMQMMQLAELLDFVLAGARSAGLDRAAQNVMSICVLPTHQSAN